VSSEGHPQQNPEYVCARAHTYSGLYEDTAPQTIPSPD
jgi:hypothetical protein